jgi:hypothetical protein
VRRSLPCSPSRDDLGDVCVAKLVLIFALDEITAGIDEKDISIRFVATEEHKRCGDANAEE